MSGTPAGAGYILLDPREIEARAPYTFFRPGEAELAAIRAGDVVKMVFEHVPPGEDWGAERMWVTVEAADGDRLSGVLDNHPSEPNASIQAGDRVAFERHHVIAISWQDPDAAPAPPERREYWDRCLVDGCVLDGSEPVEFIYREAPDMAQEGDQDADSGWRIRGRMGEATDAEMEARAPRYVALGAVLNRDDSWLHLIDAPVGARFLRDFATGEYRAEA